MTILVTGGAGYIGSHVVRQLSESGQRVVVVDNLSTGSVNALLNNEVLVTMDLADLPTLKEVFQEYEIDTVVHLAASVVAPESVKQPLRYYDNNTRNTFNMLTACVEVGVKKLVFSSTAAVYGSSETGYASEDSPTVPINPYGRSKLMCEWTIQDVAVAHGLRYVILRYFNVAGADPEGRMGQRTRKTSHLLRACCQAALGLRDRVEIYGVDYDTADGTGVRDYVHVEDIASAHLAAVNYLHYEGNSTTLNVGYGKGYSVREAIAHVKKTSGVDFPVTNAPRRPGDSSMLVAKAEKILQVLEWEPQFTSLDKIIKDTWNWEKKVSDFND